MLADMVYGASYGAVAESAVIPGGSLAVMSADEKKQQLIQESGEQERGVGVLSFVLPE